MRIEILALLGFLLVAAQTSIAAEDSADKTISKVFNVQPGGDLNIDAEEGDIHVTAENQNTVNVKIEREVPGAKEGHEESALKKHRVKITQEDNTIRVETGAAKSRGFSFHQPQEVTVHIHVTVPKRFNVTVSTAGPIDVSGVTGSVDIRSAGGDLNIANIEGSVDAHTGGGNIHASACCDQLMLQTSGGTITLSNFTGSSATLDSLGGNLEAMDCEGRLQMKTSGGNIWISKFTGTGVVADTGGGTILADIAKQPELPWGLRTGGGNIIARLAPDISININAMTDHGTASTAIPVKATVKERTTQGHIEGQIGGGGPTIMLKASAGNIEILKR